MRIAFKAVIFSITLATCVRAQSPASEGARASFDVASIKPSPSNSGTFLNLGRGQLDARGITLKFLVAYAYGFFEFQILGTPSWADSERYHILAKSEDVERDDARDKLKLQTLLAERFQLKLHSSTKEGSVYSLVIDKNGLKMTPSPEPVKGSSQLVANPGNFIGTRLTMQSLALSLSQQLGRPVRDMTELHGHYDFKLEWTPDDVQPSSNLQDSLDPIRGSLFTALREQLGLRLQTEKAQIKVLIVEKVEKPTEN